VILGLQGALAFGLGVHLPGVFPIEPLFRNNTPAGRFHDEAGNDGKPEHGDVGEHWREAE